MEFPGVGLPTRNSHHLGSRWGGMLTTRLDAPLLTTGQVAHLAVCSTRTVINRDDELCPIPRRHRASPLSAGECPGLARDARDRAAVSDRDRELVKRVLARYAARSCRRRTTRSGASLSKRCIKETTRQSGSSRESSTICGYVLVEQNPNIDCPRPDGPVVAPPRTERWPCLVRARGRRDAHRVARRRPLSGVRAPRSPAPTPLQRRDAATCDAVFVIDVDDPVAHATHQPYRPEWLAAERPKI